MVLRAAVLGSALPMLVSCVAAPLDPEAQQRIEAAAYVPSGPPALTLVTVVNNRTGSGGHTALIVSGSQQVIFDPAGSFRHPDIPRNGDVLYGMSPAWIAGYKSAHARSTYHVVTQRIEVTPAQAETALRLVRENGAVGSAFCANATSSQLRRVPGFEDINVTFYPVTLMERFAARSGVVTERYYENDSGDVVDGIRDVAS